MFEMDSKWFYVVGFAIVVILLLIFVMRKKGGGEVLNAEEDFDNLIQQVTNLVANRQ